jgi:hypothetical protein
MGLNENESVELKEPEINEKSFESDPSGSASMLFGLYYPKFSQALDTLPAKSLRRLLRALIGVPLVNASPNLKRSEERVAYSVAERLLEAKTVVTLHNLFQHQQELQKLDEPSEETSSETTPKET